MKHLVSILISLSAVSCGGSTPQPTEPQNEAPKQEEHEEKSNLQIKSELGTIDEQATDKLLDGLYPQFAACQKARLGDVPVIGGKIDFFIRVAEDGTPKYAYFNESELGDRDTEQCILKTLLSTQFPKPDGGEAEVKHWTRLSLPPDTRAPVSWSSDKVASAASDASRCNASGATVTAYVKADDKNAKKGAVVAVGVALPQKDADDAIDCVVKAVMAAKIPSPGGYYAKVSFSL
jgi:hypothetical protein